MKKKDILPNNAISVKSVVRIGAGLVLYLTKELKRMGVDKGDNLFVKLVDEDTLVISKRNLFEKYKPYGIDDKIWNQFILLCKDKTKTDNPSYKDIIKFLNEALKTWIDNETTVKISIPFIKRKIEEE